MSSPTSASADTVVEIDARLEVAHGRAHAGFEQPQVADAARREYEPLRIGPEGRPHHAIAERGQQQDVQRLLDVLVARRVPEAARGIGQDREAPTGTEKLARHYSTLAT